MSGLSLTPPTPLRILLKQMAWEQLQDIADREGWEQMGRDRKRCRRGRGTLTAFLPKHHFLLPRVDRSKGNHGEETARKKWRMRFLETDSLAPAPADGRHIEWLYPALKYSDRDAPNTPLYGPQRGRSEGP